MNEYVISALKYRPTEFNEVIGQSSITQTLTNAINLNQLPQALLFCGPRGVGKTSCARIPVSYTHLTLPTILLV